MKISFALVITATLLLFQIPARAGTITQASSGVVCTMTLRLFKFPVSVERSCPFTHENCMFDLRERRRITITQIIIAPIDDAQQ